MKFVALNSETVIELTKVMAIKAAGQNGSDIIFLNGTTIKVWMPPQDVLGIINAAIGMGVKSSPNAK